MWVCLARWREAFCRCPVVCSCLSVCSKESTNCYHRKDFLTDALIRISGISNSVGTCHSFTWIRRADLDVDRYGQPESNYVDMPSPNDVVLLARQYLHVAELNQKPLVAIPEARGNRLVHRDTPVRLLARREYNSEQKRELGKTADLVSAFPYHLHRAASYLRSLVAGTTHLGKSARPALHFTPPHSETATVAWIAPPNAIEPPEAAKIVTISPVSSKAAFGRRYGRGRGSLSAHRVTERPPDLALVEGAVGSIAVGAHGDLVPLDDEPE